MHPSDVFVCLAVCSFLATRKGLLGVVAAFRGERRAAVRAGLWAGIPAAGFLAAFCGHLFLGKGHVPDEVSLLVLLSAGICPLAAGFWAVLLAYLVPEKPTPAGPE
jgi:hypothetical protein